MLSDEQARHAARKIQSENWSRGMRNTSTDVYAGGGVVVREGSRVIGTGRVTETSPGIFSYSWQEVAPSRPARNRFRR